MIDLDFKGIGTPFLGVITGSMFAGKSKELGRIVTNIDYYNNHYLGSPINYIVLRPTTDTRKDDTRRTPYSNYVFIDPVTLDPARGIDYIDLDIYDLVAFDEAQFFSSNLIHLVKKLLAKDKQVIVVGLDKDRDGNPFSEFMQWALCACDKVVKLSAMCSECGHPSSFSLMTGVNDNPDSKVVIESDSNKYIPKCRKHYPNNYKILDIDSDLSLGRSSYVK